MANQVLEFTARTAPKLKADGVRMNPRIGRICIVTIVLAAVLAAGYGLSLFVRIPLLGLLMLSDESYEVKESAFGTKHIRYLKDEWASLSRKAPVG